MCNTFNRNIVLMILCVLSSGQRTLYGTPDLPQDIMVDVINNFGLELLKKHNEYNENNIALSPYGAVSVLVALSEGTQGTANNEIQRSLRLPYDSSIIRIGLRDVLRRLRSYFIPEEGFLAGLTFSNDNISLKEDYKNLLMFYGYDIESFNSPLYTTTTRRSEMDHPSTASTSQTTTAASEMTTTPEIAVTPQAESTMIISSFIEHFGTTVNAMPVTDKNIQNSTSAFVTAEEVAQSSTSMTTSATATEEITEVTIPVITSVVVTEESSTPPTTSESITNKLSVSESSTSALLSTEIIASAQSTTTPSTVSTTIQTTTKVATTEETTPQATKTIEETTPQVTITTEEFTPNAIVTATTVTNPTTVETSRVIETMTRIPTTVTDNPTENSASAESVSTESTSDLTITQSIASNINSEESSPLFTMETETVTEASSTTESEISTSSEATQSGQTDGLVEVFSTASTVEGGDTAGTTILTSVTSSENSEEESTTIQSTIADDTTISIDATTLENENKDNITAVTSESKRKRSAKDDNRLTIRHYLPADYRTYDHDDTYKSNYEDDPSVLTFLINGKTRKSNISFMTYKAVLPFCYIPNLKSLALSFPLDSTKYYLLLILPVDDCGADFVLERMGYDITLKEIVSRLTFTYVKATIPSFMLKGTVLLTSTLQKLGIQTVFEPRGADFSRMTDAADIYVTNIEQLITVTIRNYINPNTLDNYGNRHQYGPVQFKADHPFLYFVMDSNLHVTLMAGKVINPLNSRIS